MSHFTQSFCKKMSHFARHGHKKMCQTITKFGVFILQPHLPTEKREKGFGLPTRRF